MKKILRYLDKTEFVMLAILFAAMSILCVMQVFFRYFLRLSLPWAEEMMRGVFVWASCIGISEAFKRYAHLGVDFFVNLFNDKAKHWLKFVAYVICGIFFIALIKIGTDFTIMQINQHRMMTSMNVSQAVVSVAIPIGGLFSLIRVIEIILRDYFGVGKNVIPEEPVAEESEFYGQ
ncbi:MAG: TRAP transporter small permease [Eubacterium sp.]|nr:TRAP transporter small permease [Eubacterium sp.]